MATFIAIQSTYTHIEMGFFKDHLLQGMVSIDKIQATQQSIPELDALLHHHKLTLKDFDFIAVNQGPGPFTTLRVVISMVNGLSYATALPLVGVDGLHGFLEEYAFAHPTVAVLLNAFSNDLYYGLSFNKSTLYTGIAASTAALDHIAQKTAGELILFVGNGVEHLGAATIQTAFGNRALFLDPNPATISLQQVANIGLGHWQENKNISSQIQPSYYKPAFMPK